MFRIEEYILRLIQKQYFPGIVILYARNDQIIFHKAFGNRALVPEPEIMTEDTIFDLASLTKPLVTSFLTLLAIQKKLIDPETAVSEIFPELKTGIKIKNLLIHNAGLPDFFTFYLFSENIIESFKKIVPRKPAKKVIYSCPGYILLKLILEKVYTENIELVAKREIFKKLSLKDTYINPQKKVTARVAPTENGNVYEHKLCIQRGFGQAENYPFRQEMIRGVVHDVNSFYLNGFGGNAGLFSTAAEVFLLAREFFPRMAQILKPDLLKLCWENQTPFSLTHRSLGFKINSSLQSSGGKALSPKAIGHNGFTGTSLWLDQKDCRTMILLANAVHPEVKGRKLDPLRRRIHLLLKKEFG